MKKRKTKSKLLFWAAAIFSIYVVATLIQNQIRYNELAIEKTKLEKKIENQEIINAGIKQASDSERTRQYIISTARRKIGLVMPNEIVFIDIGH